MTKKNLFQIFALSSLACGLIACSTAPIGTAKIIKEDQSQIALLLNKNLSVTVIGLKEGTRVGTCGEIDTSNKSNRQPSEASCKNNLDGRIPPFYEEKFTISVYQGSCCAYVKSESSGVVSEYCNPPRSIKFVETVTGKKCE